VKQDERNPMRVVEPLFGKVNGRAAISEDQPASDGMCRQQTVETVLNFVATFYFANKACIFINSVFTARRDNPA
jgi:hypothetical protein